ncbi:MAG: hypothetical protein JWQ87_811 [Candidatus Sulfotelmatobacter sp.]|nr:hypothetical protein [Candidatus Sulfotelmatobacter sp.]
MSNSTGNFSGSSASGPRWREFYQAAMLELDDAKMSQRISDARHAILGRAEEILTGLPTDERVALNDALNALRVLEQTTAKRTPAA